MNLSPDNRSDEKPAIPPARRCSLPRQKIPTIYQFRTQSPRSSAAPVPRILPPKFRETVSQWACPGILLVSLNFSRILRFPAAALSGKYPLSDKTKTELFRPLGLRHASPRCLLYLYGDKVWTKIHSTLFSKTVSQWACPGILLVLLISVSLLWHLPLPYFSPTMR